MTTYIDAQIQNQAKNPQASIALNRVFYNHLDNTPSGFVGKPEKNVPILKENILANIKELEAIKPSDSDGDYCIEYIDRGVCKDGTFGLVEIHCSNALHCEIIRNLLNIRYSECFVKIDHSDKTGGYKLCYKVSRNAALGLWRVWQFEIKESLVSSDA